MTKPNDAQKSFVNARRPHATGAQKLKLEQQREREQAEDIARFHRESRARILNQLPKGAA